MKIQEEAHRIEEMVEHQRRNNLIKDSDSITSNPTNRSDKQMYKQQSHGYHVKKQRSKDGGGRDDAPKKYLSIS